MLDLIRDGATHVGVATDHVIESFRNDLYEGYKDGSGVEPDLLAQFPEIEHDLRAAGFTVFAMVDHEADDALASAAVAAAADPRVQRAVICTPDKDLGQCVRTDGRIVQYDRRKRLLIDRAAVLQKFGVPPESIPDYLGLVGDTADGFPGLAGWGAKSSATVLARYAHIEFIPDSADDWDVTVRGAAKLAATLSEHRDDALLFREIATLVCDLDLFASVDELLWRGPTPDFDSVCDRLDAPHLARRAEHLASES
jgi:5'-3' exonuclease